MSVGHAALMGVGAYAGAILATQFRLGALRGVAVRGPVVSAVGRGAGRAAVAARRRPSLTSSSPSRSAASDHPLTNGGASPARRPASTSVRSAPSSASTSASCKTTISWCGLPDCARDAAPTWVVAHSRYGRTLRSIRENEALARVRRRRCELAQDPLLHAERRLRGRRRAAAGLFPSHISPDSLRRVPERLYRADGDARRRADALRPARSAR